MTLEPRKRRGAPPPTGREDRMNSGTLCGARRKSDGEPCTNFARKGTNRCRKHGGNAPQVLAAAQVRLLMASDRLMAQLLQIAENKSEPTPVRLAAIRDALDRAGLGAKQQIEIEAKVETWETRIEAAVVDWGELRALKTPEGSALDVVEYAPEDATLDWSERPDPHREARQAEVAEAVQRIPQRGPNGEDELPSWIGERTGAQHATHLADEHRRAAFEADRASKGLAPRKTRPRR